MQKFLSFASFFKALGFAAAGGAVSSVSDALLAQQGAQIDWNHTKSVALTGAVLGVGYYIKHQQALYTPVPGSTPAAAPDPAPAPAADTQKETK